ncbi:hypothetical protein IGI39_002717 [Enterococcus sp. AZ135]|uniref:hypothetical protein n=1 Tax=unclassified Enterococcus TaxID=2608891 RepID=UPI003F285F73
MKKVILLLGLILGICNVGVTAFAEESQIEIQINTRDEKGFVHEGTENITLDVFDLTEWRSKRASNEKSDKEYIMNTYSSKEKLAAFVASEALKKVNGTSLVLDDKGSASITLPRYQNEKDAAYLILSSGETGKYHMLPIVVYLPQLLADSTREYTSLLFNCKYDEIPTIPTTEPPPSTTPTTTTKSTEPPITDSSGPRKDLPKTIGTPSGGEGPKSYSGKELPSTNELIRNYCFLGLLLMIVGLVGLNKNKGEKNYEK